MRLVALGALCLVVSAGSAAGTTTAALRPTLSFIVDAGVSDRGFVPLGGGICLGNRRVTEPRPDGGISWSPDGRRVAFYRQTGTVTADVFVADADGGHLRNLSSGEAQFSWAPDWSPDGSRLVYVASDPHVERLITLRPDGSDRRVVPGVSADPNQRLGEPHWSPDGAFIGFTLNEDLHVVRQDGSEQRMVLADAVGFDWSPDGRRIAFTRDRDLALANSDGSGATVVTRTPDLHEGGLEWSPDGSQMVYVAADETDPKVEQGPGDHMYLADANGRNKRELRGPRGVAAWSPAWRSAAPLPRGSRPCALLGTSGDDVLGGTARGELIYGRGGSDLIRGHGGDDIIVGDVPFSRQRGKDRLFGGPGRDFLDSTDERRDVVNGGPGLDRGVFDLRDRVTSVEKYG
jgi:WD40-like Beta Propeller Repeat/RTX calcium-binding nonapeptide repeat (4 copies)